MQYEYTIPVSSASISEEEEVQTQWNELGQPLDYVDDNNVEGDINRTKQPKRRKFFWKLLGFGPCNRSCGPGIRPPIFRCMRGTHYYSPKRCAYVEKLTLSEEIFNCNRGLCPAYWSLGDFGECNCNSTVDGVHGIRTRRIQCVQEQNNGKIELVPETLCPLEKISELSETCNCPNHLRRQFYARSPEKAPKVVQRLLSAPTRVRNVYNSTAPLRRYLRDNRQDKAGVWLMSAWNKDCVETCELGYEHRSIYCDRTPPFTDLCDLRHTPEQKRLCSEQEESDECLEGKWFASEWSKCMGECFNLQRKRIVLCLKNGLVVDEVECNILRKPMEVQNCTQKEVEYCGPKWHYSEWSEVSSKHLLQKKFLTLV